MKILRAAFVLTVLMLSASWYIIAAAPTMEESIVGVRQGAWAKYIGAPPSEEYEWIRFSVLQVNGSVVDLELRYDLRMRFRLYSSYHFPDHPRYVHIDVEDGTSNFFFFLIPRNLSVGCVVPTWRGHAPLSIEGAEKRVYAGAERTVLYASFSNMTNEYANFTIAGKYYWDKDTGVLVERIATLGNTDITAEKLIETNNWSPELRFWIAANLPALGMLVMVVGGMVISMGVLLRLRKISNKVSHTYFGAGLFACGVAFAVTSVFYLTTYEQLVSSFCFALAPFFIVTGIFVYTGAWVTPRKGQLIVDKGVMMVAVALILGGLVFACFTYRNLEAIVPYLDDYDPAGTGGSVIGRGPVTYTSLEGVFVYPYAWLASVVLNVIVCLAAMGILYKIAQRF